MKAIEKVELLKKYMKKNNMDAYIIPSTDAHMSEYVAEYYRSRAWISGFTGSAGTCVITMDKNGLWTDGRYYIQAEKQLKGSSIDLFKMGQQDVPSFVDWIRDSLDEGSTVGFDGRLFSVSSVRDMMDKFSKKKIKINYEHDLIDLIWTDRPSLPKNKIFIHDVKYAGKSRVEKINDVRKHMKSKGASLFLLTSLDDIAWLYNIRGNDVAFSPVSICTSVITNESAYLFIDKEKVDEDTQEILRKDGIEIMEYNDVESFLKNIDEKNAVLFDKDKVNYVLYKCIPEKCIKIEESPNITTMMKSIKNEVEIKNLKNCHVRDGVAMVKFMYWLHQNIGKQKITEISVANKLRELRSQQDKFKDVSFNTIAAYKEHAAMMHYSATPETDYELKKEGFLLVDSGAQYLDGTTDITRTFILGELTEEQKFDYTLTLKSNLDLSKAKFLYGTTGDNLDVIAREPMWKNGLDYKCGTGHGVGFFLNVHEGPQRISPHKSYVKMEEGMITTDEPGVYKEGKYGIRIENELLCLKAEKTDCGQFMKFEPITYCPIDTEGVNVDMLDEEERQYLNEYHEMVYEKLSPYLNEDEREFLRHKTRKL